jgi:aldehyde:ferredoxin oxidoreductase
MSKTVCAFKSPYHDQYAESHAGGRSALSLRFADYDALVISGKAKTPSCLSVGAKHLAIEDVHYLWGKDVHATGKMLRRMFPGSGHRSILRIGQAGEAGSPMACINVDSYRHFGRLGSGGVMGSKNLKGIFIQGNGAYELGDTKEYSKVFKKVYEQLTDTRMMSKYHNFGTPANLEPLNALKSLPWRNLQQTHDSKIEQVTGERFAEETLLRNAACSGCPVGCIHIGFVREKFMEENQYLYRQVAYDFEPIFSVGTMLGITECTAILALIDTVEKTGLDVMSSGVALAWATEAFQKGLIAETETIVPLTFGDVEAYQKAMLHLGKGSNEFYRLLTQGTMKAVNQYGGGDFACVLGQEMAGYATGEVFFTAQNLGFRHSHLDAGGYSFDQQHEEKDVEGAVDFLVRDEKDRVFLTSMVACLFARGVYTDELMGECLRAVGYGKLADNMDGIAESVQRLRWKTRLATGFKPEKMTVPKRFTEVINWKGKVDEGYLEQLQAAYAKRIVEMVEK